MIRNELYTKYLYEISSLSRKLGDALDSLPNNESGTMEENEIYNALYFAHDKLVDAERAIRYFSKDTKEGYLDVNDCKRFVLDDIEFTCGSPIEVYLEDDPENNVEEGWYSGRVEGRGRGEYYFFGANSPSLYEGMKVRVREDAF